MENNHEIEDTVSKNVKYRLYCAVHGCRNSTITHPEMTFFKLAKFAKRRLQWLKLICREDLQNKSNFYAYRVCEIHFRNDAIQQSKKRKLLKSKALPVVNVPGLSPTDPVPIALPGKAGKPTRRKYVRQHKILQNYKQTNERYTQTSTSLFCDNPKKRKTKTESQFSLDFNNGECSKKRKIEETENDTEESDKNTFHRLCDKFLNDNLAFLIKAQSNQNQQGKENQYDKEYINYCLNLHYMSPQAYRFLQSVLYLPCPTTIYKNKFPITTELDERAMALFQMKVAHMTEGEKNCSVIIGAMPLRENLFYNIKEDIIKGFQEIDGMQSPEPANNALIIMVRGLYVNWKQPVAYALVSECPDYDEINAWIDKVLRKLFEIGLVVRIFVSNHDSDLWTAYKDSSISVETPYFFLDDRKIYYCFDAPHLIKDVRDSLMQYDIQFGNSVAKFDHVIQFYNQDIKSNMRFAPRLTSSHTKPNSFAKKKVYLATQLLSRTVSNGICAYANKNENEVSGRDTAIFLMMMNDLFDSLNSSNLRQNYEYKKAYTGDESQMAFFKKMVTFFQELKLRDPKNGLDCTSSVRFTEGFQVTIYAIMLLFDDLRVEGYNYLMTRRCNQDVLENLFGQIRTKSGTGLNPTSRQFALAFKSLFFKDVMTPPKKVNHEDDFGKLLLKTTHEEVNRATNSRNKMTDTDFDDFSSLKIDCSEYNQLDMPEENSLFYICEYLIKRCVEKHDDCQILKSYKEPALRGRNSKTLTRFSRFEDFSKDNEHTFVVIPSDVFVEYVEKLEDIFQRSLFRTKHTNSKLAVNMYSEMKDIQCVPPCPCFPTAYLIKLFIRLRIFYTLKFNNEGFRTSKSGCKYFIVPNL